MDPTFTVMSSASLMILTTTVFSVDSSSDMHASPTVPPGNPVNVFMWIHPGDTVMNLVVLDVYNLVNY